MRSPLMARFRPSNCLIPMHRQAESRIVSITAARDDAWNLVICSTGIMDKQLQRGVGTFHADLVVVTWRKASPYNACMLGREGV